LPEKQKNGSSNHGEPFFLGPLLTSPKGRERRRKGKKREMKMKYKLKKIAPAQSPLRGLGGF